MLGLGRTNKRIRTHHYTYVDSVSHYQVFVDGGQQAPRWLIRHINVYRWTRATGSRSRYRYDVLPVLTLVPDKVSRIPPSGGRLKRSEISTA